MDGGYLNIIARFTYAKTLRRRGDVALMFHKAKHDFGYLDQHTIRKQMKLWRKEAKKGSLVVRPCNNKTKTTDCGQKYHFLVVQSTNPEAMDIDAFGLFVLGEMVIGFVYAFFHKKNRDAVAKYIMKGVAVSEN